jgi:leader peptidase (prepilin peptidase)/N-methyltransferase
MGEPREAYENSTSANFPNRSARLFSRPAGPMGDRGNWLEGPTLTAKAEVNSTIGGSGASRVALAWITVGRRGQAATLTVAGAGAVATAIWVPDTRAAVATGLSVLVLVAAALVDAVEHRLPNVLVGVAAVPVLAAAAVAWVTGATDVVAGAGVGALVLGGPLLVTHLVSPAGMGFGDVKAGAVLGAALGLINVQIAVLALLLGLAGVAGWALARRRRTIALGPGLVAGAVAALLVARILNLEALS